MLFYKITKILLFVNFSTFSTITSLPTSNLTFSSPKTPNHQLTRDEKLAVRQANRKTKIGARSFKFQDNKQQLQEGNLIQHRKLNPNLITEELSNHELYQLYYSGKIEVDEDFDSHNDYGPNPTVKQPVTIQQKRAEKQQWRMASPSNSNSAPFPSQTPISPDYISLAPYVYDVEPEIASIQFLKENNISLNDHFADYNENLENGLLFYLQSLIPKKLSADQLKKMKTSKRDIRLDTIEQNQIDTLNLQKEIAEIMPEMVPNANSDVITYQAQNKELEEFEEMTDDLADQLDYSEEFLFALEGIEPPKDPVIPEAFDLLTSGLTSIEKSIDSLEKLLNIRMDLLDKEINDVKKKEEEKEVKEQKNLESIYQNSNSNLTFEDWLQNYPNVNMYLDPRSLFPLYDVEKYGAASLRIGSSNTQNHFFRTDPSPSPELRMGITVRSGSVSQQENTDEESSTEIEKIHPTNVTLINDNLDNYNNTTSSENCTALLQRSFLRSGMSPEEVNQLTVSENENTNSTQNSNSTILTVENLNQNYTCMTFENGTSSLSNGTEIVEEGEKSVSVRRSFEYFVAIASFFTSMYLLN